MACLIKRANGVFYAVSCKRGKRIWLSLGTKDLGEASLAMAQIRAASPQRRYRMLKDFWNEISPIVRSECVPNTHDFYGYVVNLLVEVIGNKSMKAYSAMDFDRYKVHRSNEVSKTTVNKEIRTIRALFGKALRYNYVESNEAAKCAFFRVDQSSPQFISPDQLHLLLQRAPSEALYAIIMLAVNTAMRAGEILSLEWQDVDWENGDLWIRTKSFHRTKNGKERSVPMNAIVRSLLESRKCENGRVFLDDERRPITVKSLSDKFRRLRKKAGLPEWVHFHTLRHTALTWLHHEGVPSESMRQIAGHSSIQTTHLYTHTSKAHLMEAVGRLAAMTGNPMKIATLLIPANRATNT